MHNAADALASIAACAFLAGVLSGIILYGFEELLTRHGVNRSIIKRWIDHSPMPYSDGTPTASQRDLDVESKLLFEALPPTVMALRYRELLGILSGLLNTGDARDDDQWRLVKALAAHGRRLAGESNLGSREAELMYAERALDNLQATFSIRWQRYRAISGALFALALLAAVVIATQNSPGEAIRDLPLYVVSLIFVGAVSSVLAPLTRDIVDRISGTQ